VGESPVIRGVLQYRSPPIYIAHIKNPTYKKKYYIYYMGNWIIRVREECDELGLKVIKLYDFVNSDLFDGVSDDQQFLLRDQLRHMRSYESILRQRLLGTDYEV